jgi:pimeloyl-ACP methyl ester carboxylesterase
MTEPVVTATTLVTEDGVPIDAVHLPGPKDLAIIVVHGFTLSWQRPSVWRIASRFNRMAGVITFDLRGHGRSGGLSTLGDLEIKDLDAAVAWARELGYQRVAAVGFSMGASIVLRHAGLIGGLEAVVSVSGPGRWYYRGTERMRWVHRAVERRSGRYVTRHWLKTRISPEGWKLIPVPPAEAAAKIAPVPLLIVHGEKDLYFPPEHARQLYMAARQPKELWLLPEMGHAESASDPDLVDRIGRWVDQATRESTAAPDATPAADAPQPSTPRRGRLASRGRPAQRTAGQRTAGQRTAGQRTAGQRTAGQRTAGQRTASPADSGPSGQRAQRTAPPRVADVADAPRVANVTRIQRDRASHHRNVSHEQLSTRPLTEF